MDRIQDGQPAIDFTAQDFYGNQIRLADYEGLKLMLSFYRYASCPLCNLRIHELIKRHPALMERGLQMLAVFQSPSNKIREHVGKQNVPFPIIADPDNRLYELYGVRPSATGFAKAAFRPDRYVLSTLKGFLPGMPDGKLTMVPADFLIDEQMIVKKAYYGKDISDHLPIREIFKFLE